MLAEKLGKVGVVTDVICPECEEGGWKLAVYLTPEVIRQILECVAHDAEEFEISEGLNTKITPKGKYWAFEVLGEYVAYLREEGVKKK